MKKIVKLTESDLTRIVKKVISEQTEERNYTRAIQRFLNKKFPELKLVVDGRTGPNSQTEAAIEKYQKLIKADVDGIWNSETTAKMPEQDLKLLKKYVSEEGDLFDKFLHWVGLD